MYLMRNESIYTKDINLTYNRCIKEQFSMEM